MAYRTYHRLPSADSTKVIVVDSVKRKESRRNSYLGSNASQRALHSPEQHVHFSQFVASKATEGVTSSSNSTLARLLPLVKSHHFF